MATRSGAKLPGLKRTLDCDGAGPSLGTVRLLTPTPEGLAPRSVEELAFIWKEAFGRPVDCMDLSSGLSGIADALNKGELGRAMILSQRLPSPPLEHADLARAAMADALLKASPDDPKHPGYPKGAPDGRGGQFRPKQSEGPAPGGRGRISVPKDSADDPAQTAQLSETAERDVERAVGREAVRKAAREAIRRFLERRAARIALEAGGAFIPGVDIVDGAVALADAIAAAKQIADVARDTDAAMAFAEAGPYELGELKVSKEDIPVRSMNEFRKDALDKRFGPASAGYEYHHIVEQSAGEVMPPGQLHSTANVIRIPRFFHEAISAEYSTVREYEGQRMTLRQYLRGKPFEFQRDWGLKVMRELGILKGGAQ